MYADFNYYNFLKEQLLDDLNQYKIVRNLENFLTSKLINRNQINQSLKSMIML